MNHSAVIRSPREAVTTPEPVTGHVPARRSDVHVREIDNEALLYDPATGSSHRLNETALFIWQRCDGCHGADELVALTARAYEVSPEEASRAVLELLDALERQRLIHWRT